MYKTASHHRAQGAGLQEYLLEGEEKTAVLGFAGGAVGNYMGEREEIKALRDAGYTPSQIEAARSGTRGKFMSGLSSELYAMGGGLAGGIIGGRAGSALGGLTGVGIGSYRNYKIKRRAMRRKARELRGMDSESKRS